MKYLLLVVFFCYTYRCSAQKASIIKLAQLEELLNQANDTTYIINFWATWCQPCIKEMPYFREAEAKYKNEKVRFIYISLDFKREIDTRLNAYLKQNNFNSTVFLIDEPDYDKWINKVDSSWQGNIPATLFYNNAKNTRDFFPKDLNAEELSEALKKFL